MRNEIAGKIYEIVIGSDVVNDGFYAEMNDVTQSRNVTVLFAFYSDKKHDATFTAYQQDIPFEAVEWFISTARLRLFPLQR